MENSKKVLISVFAIGAAVAAGWFIVSGSQNSTGITQNQDLNLNEDKNEVVAKVNDEEITSRELARMKQTLGPKGQQIPDKQILEQVINQKLLSQEAQKEGYSVTKDEAESMLESQLQQQDKSLDEYKQQLSSKGVSFEAQLPKLRKDLAIQEYLDAELESPEVTNEEAKNFYDKQKEQSPNEIPPYEEIESQIKQTLRQQKQQREIGPLTERLRENANIEYLKEFKTATSSSQ